MQVRGRFFVLAWGAVFLVVAATISVRQYRAFATVARVAVLQDSVKAVRSVHGDVGAQLAGMRSPDVLRPRAESLGLRQPSEDEQVPLSVPRR